MPALDEASPLGRRLRVCNYKLQCRLRRLLQMLPGLVKTHASEMVHGGAERREVKWCMTLPTPSEIA